MCGRYVAAFTMDELRELFPMAEQKAEHSPRYNIAPTQQALIVAQEEQLTIDAKAFGIKARETLVINARAETMQEKKIFQRLNRCLIPASGFYEWRERTPYYFTLPNKPIFAFAGLFDSCGFVIITTEPNELVAPIHNRMPVILSNPSEYISYLNGSLCLLQPYAGDMAYIEVTKYVNSTLHDDAKCIVPVNKLW